MKQASLRSTGPKNRVEGLLKKVAEHAQLHSQEAAPPKRRPVQ